jgi:UrcA family protein
MSRSIKSILLTTLGVVATTQIAIAGVPANRVEVGRVAVSYGDLDLGNAADARVMLSRLQRAAYDACGGDPRWNPTYELLWVRLTADYHECRRDAVSRAVAAVDAPLLSQVFLGGDDQRASRGIASSR